MAGVQKDNAIKKDNAICVLGLLRGGKSVGHERWYLRLLQRVDCTKGTVKRLWQFQCQLVRFFSVRQCLCEVRR